MSTARIPASPSGWRHWTRWGWCVVVRSYQPYRIRRGTSWRGRSLPVETKEKMRQARLQVIARKRAEGKHANQP